MDGASLSRRQKKVKKLEPPEEEISPIEKYGISILSTESRTKKLLEELKEFNLSHSNKLVFVERVKQAYIDLSIMVHEFNTDVEQEFKVMPDFRSKRGDVEWKRKTAEMWNMNKIEWIDKMNRLMRSIEKSLGVNYILNEIVFTAFEKISGLIVGVKATSEEETKVQISAARARRNNVLDQWADKRQYNMQEAQKYAEKGEKLLLLEESNANVGVNSPTSNVGGENVQETKLSGSEAAGIQV